MIDQLTRYLLKRFEASPYAKFYESELTSISSSGFPVLKKRKSLLFDQYDFEQESYFDKEGNERFVRKVNGRWIATSTEDSEISPLYLKEQALNRYIFDVQPLLTEINTKNNLSKRINSVTSRIWFIGETTVIQNSVGIFLAFISDDEQAEAELLGLKAKIGKVDGVLVLCPTYQIKSQDILNKLTAQNIVCLTFNEAFKQNYVIEFSRVRFDQPSAPLKPKLSGQQITDYSKHQYLCYDTLHILGSAPMKRSNDLQVNGHAIKIPDKAFGLLLELVVELKRGKGGWLTKVVQAGKYQPFDRLRKPLEGSLLERDAKKFIENNASKQYRISTHPDFVTYDRNVLLKHTLKEVQDMAKKLPKN